MIIDLINLEKSPFDFEFPLAAFEIDLESDIAKLKNTVTTKGKLTKRTAQIDVEGKISADIEVDCTRCLKSVDKTLEFPFSVSYVTPENYSEAKETELRNDDLDVAVFEGDKIDLTELVREQILLNLPVQVFCKEDCKGLCEKCGANLNLTDCNCKEEEIDPRWAALKNLK